MFSLCSYRCPCCGSTFIRGSRTLTWSDRIFRSFLKPCRCIVCCTRFLKFRSVETADPVFPSSGPDKIPQLAWRSADFAAEFADDIPSVNGRYRVSRLMRLQRRFGLVWQRRRVTLAD